MSTTTFTSQSRAATGRSRHETELVTHTWTVETVLRHGMWTAVLKGSAGQLIAKSTRAAEQEAAITVIRATGIHKPGKVWERMKGKRGKG